jgi:hypothetical protein
MGADQTVNRQNEPSATEANVATPPRGGGANSGARLNVNINSKTAEELRRIAKEAGVSYTETVRRAVELLAFVMDERGAGHAIQVYDPERDRTRELITL